MASKKYILVYTTTSSDNYETTRNVQYPATEKELHARVADIARGHEKFEIECAAEISKSWMYEAAQIPVKVVEKRTRRKK